MELATPAQLDTTRFARALGLHDGTVFDGMIELKRGGQRGRQLSQPLWWPLGGAIEYLVTAAGVFLGEVSTAQLGRILTYQRRQNRLHVLPVSLVSQLVLPQSRWKVSMSSAVNASEKATCAIRRRRSPATSTATP